MWAVANSPGVRTSSSRGPWSPSTHSRTLVASNAVGRVVVAVVDPVEVVMVSSAVVVQVR